MTFVSFLDCLQITFCLKSLEAFIDDIGKQGHYPGYQRPETALEKSLAPRVQGHRETSNKETTI